MLVNIIEKIEKNELVRDMNKYEDNSNKDDVLIIKHSKPYALPEKEFFYMGQEFDCLPKKLANEKVKEYKEAGKTQHFKVKPYFHI